MYIYNNQVVNFLPPITKQRIKSVFMVGNFLPLIGLYKYEVVNFSPPHTSNYKLSILNI